MDIADTPVDMDENYFRRTLGKVAQTSFFSGHSINLDARSLNYNYECGVGILDGELGNDMKEMFRQDLLESTPITETDQSAWPLHERVLGTFFSWFRSYL